MTAPRAKLLGGLACIVADRLLIAEIGLAALLSVLIWFPNRLSAIALATLPLVWVLRWLRTGSPTGHAGYELPLLGISVTVLISSVAIVNLPAAINRIGGVMVGMTLLFTVSSALRATPRPIESARWVVLGGALWLAAVGLVGTDWFTRKLLPLQPVYDLLPLLIRGMSSLTPNSGIHPNQTAGALVVLLPVLMAITAGTFKHSISRWQQAASTVATTAVLVILVLTQSRSGYIAALIGCLPIAFVSLDLRRRLRSHPAIWLAGIGGALLIGGTVVWLLVSTWNEPGNESLDTLPTRLELWQRAIMAIADFPFTGIGMGQFHAALMALYPPVLIAPKIEVAHAHNWYLQTALDLGLPGLLSTLVLVAAYVRRVLLALHPPDQNEEHFAFAFGLLGGMLAFLVFGLTDAVVLGARSAASFWIILALSTVFAASTPNSTPKPSATG